MSDLVKVRYCSGEVAIVEKKNLQAIYTSGKPVFEITQIMTEEDHEHED